jgi:hypothetical protein
MLFQVQSKQITIISLFILWNRLCFVYVVREAQKTVYQLSQPPYFKPTTIASML